MKPSTQTEAGSPPRRREVTQFSAPFCLKLSGMFLLYFYFNSSLKNHKENGTSVEGRNGDGERHPRTSSLLFHLQNHLHFWVFGASCSSWTTSSDADTSVLPLGGNQVRVRKILHSQTLSKQFKFSSCKLVICAVGLFWSSFPDRLSVKRHKHTCNQKVENQF